MKEILHVYDSSNCELASCDLEKERGPLLAIRTGVGISFAPAAAVGDEVLAALMRDEDGWTIASPDPSRPLRSGSKTVQDLHLMPGLPCQIDGLVVRLERDSANTGSTLLWRYAGSPVAADPVPGGPSEMTLSRETHRPEINSAVSGEPLFEFYQTEEEFVVSTGEDVSGRLVLPYDTLFTVGRFEGMFMKAADAVKALRSRNPFAWPGRSIRFRLELAAFALLALAAFAMFNQKRLIDLRAAISEYRGAVEIAPFEGSGRIAKSVRDEVHSFNLALFRILPSVLTAEPNKATQDLIQRGSQLASDPGVVAKVAFLKDVRAIQETIRTGRWQELRGILAGVNTNTFVECDADGFLRDAREIARILVQKLPQRITAATEIGKAEEFERFRRENESGIRELSDNLFMTGTVVTRECAQFAARLKVLDAYVKARKRTLDTLKTGGNGIAPDDLLALYEGWIAVRGEIGDDAPGFEEFNRRETELLGKTVTDCAAAVGDSVLLSPLADFAEVLAFPRETFESWRERAKSAMKALDIKCRSLYSEYRMLQRTDRAKAAEVLERLVGIADRNNGFRQWAQREMEKITKGGRK